MTEFILIHAAIEGGHIINDDGKEENEEDYWSMINWLGTLSCILVRESGTASLSCASLSVHHCPCSVQFCCSVGG